MIELPIPPEAQTMTPATVNKGSPAELAAIQAFNPSETIGDHYSLVKDTMALNAPNLIVDAFVINGALYDIDPRTNRVVEYEANRTANYIGPAQNYTRDELKQMAIQRVLSQAPEVDLAAYSYNIEQKTDNFFFEWSKGIPGEPGYQRVFYVAYQTNGFLLGFIDALP